MTLAIFDFDGTLTTKDSLFEFLKFYAGSIRFYWLLVLFIPTGILYFFKLIPNWKAKQSLLSLFISNQDSKSFQNKADAYALDKIHEILRKEAMDKLMFHKDEGHEIVVVSASAENWLREWCSQESISLLGTRLEVINGYMTGKIAGKNCYGPEKVTRLKEAYDLSKYDQIFAYGDSNGDRELLSIATHPFYRKFW